MDRWRLRRLWAALRSAVGAQEVLLTIGLVLVVAGLWEVSRPAALAVPGVVLIWIAMPSRPSFFERDVKRS